MSPNTLTLPELIIAVLAGLALGWVLKTFHRGLRRIVEKLVMRE